MNLRSCIYVGSVMHRRLRPRAHHFRYRAFWLLIDLDELPSLSATLRLFSHNRPAVFSLYNIDHGDGSSTPLRNQVERQLDDAGLDIGGGPIQLLCMPRTLGYCFNPLSIYFCHYKDGTLAARIYQVHNTFGERHSYVIPAGQRGSQQQQCRKSFYVSPFMDMALRYDFRVTDPVQRVAVGIRATAADGPVFDAVLMGVRNDLTDRALVRVGLAIPLVTLKVILAIHWEALRLWLKGMRYRGRPSARKPLASIVPASSANPD